MQILHVVTSVEEEAAGPSYSVPALARGLARGGHETMLLSLGPVGQLIDGHFTHQKFSAFGAGLPLIQSLKLAPKMAQVMRTTEPEIIHAHGIWQMPFIYAARAKAPTGAKLVLAPRGMLAAEALKFSKGRKRVFSLLWQNRALAKVDLFHATSEQEYADIRSYGLRQPVMVVPNGIDIPEEATPLKSDGQKTVLYLGRIHPIKFIDDLLLAWRALETNHPDWRVRIVGPGLPQDIEKLRRLIVQMDLRRVTLENGVFGADKLTAYQAADLYILPSRSENFAMTIAEALAAGVPAIATKGAPWQAMITNRCGWSTDFGAEALGAALRAALLLSDEERQTMGANGREWMRRDYSWDRIAQDIAKGYAWATSGGEMPVTLRIE